jgi:hypothetical protein
MQPQPLCTAVGFAAQRNMVARRTRQVTDHPSDPPHTGIDSLVAGRDR